MIRPYFIPMIAFVMICVALAADFSSAEDALWPGFMGPERNGWVKDFEPPQAWPEKLTKAWSVEVGTGYGSPIVYDDKVFQHARQEDNELVWVIELKTGNVISKSATKVPFKAAGGGEWHGTGPKSSPVYADGKIFTMSITGTLSAVDTRFGAPLWTRNYDKQFGKSHPNWGASTSPIVDGERVIVHFGTDEKGALIALNVETGQEVWVNGEDGASYSSPLLVEIAGVRQVVQWNHEALVGVESKTGKLLWSVPFPHESHNQNMPTPTFYRAQDGGRILLGAENRGIHSFQPAMKDGVWTVKRNWSQEDVALDMSTAVMNGEYLFGLSHYKKGRLFCLDPNTGEVLWQSPERTAQNVAFLSIPGHVIALLDHGQLQILADTSDKYTKLAEYKVSENSTWAPPVLLDNGFLIKDEKSLTMWTFEEAASK